MATTIAQISPFDIDNDNFVEYEERFSSFLIANGITDEGKKKATFIAILGGPAYKLLRSLCQNDTSSKTYQQLVSILKEHLNPTPNTIAERFHFYKRDRKTGESIHEYVAELRKMSEHCSFGANLNDYLRDRFVCGLNSSSIQQKLLTIKDLTLTSAVETAHTYETAYKDAKALRGSNSGGSGEVVEERGLFKLGEKGREGGRRECFRCGSPAHLANKCPFANLECFKCGKTGHKATKCFKGSKGGILKKKDGEEGSSKSGNDGVRFGKVEKVSVLDEEEEEIFEEMDFLRIKRMSRNVDVENPPIMVGMMMNGKDTSIELDTGAVVTVMSDDEYSKFKSDDLPLKKSNLALKTYTGEIVRPRGIGSVDVDYEGQKCRLPVTVVDGDYPTLLGRDWLGQGKLKLNWDKLLEEVKEVHKTDVVDEKVVELVEEFKEVFSEKLGCLKDFKVHIPVDPTVQPKFHRARPVPYGQRDRVEEELDRL